MRTPALCSARLRGVGSGGNARSGSGRGTLTQGEGGEQQGEKW